MSAFQNPAVGSSLWQREADDSRSSSCGFDAWLRDSLARQTGATLREPIPDELLELLEDAFQ